MTDKGEFFWKCKSLEQMSDQEWESLCDGCGKCCLHKFQDTQTNEFLFTSICCRYLDSESCRCQVYQNRKSFVPDCLCLSADHLGAIQWLPSTCAYRLLSEGKDLPDWHHLVSGDTQILHIQHISVRGKVISEADVSNDDWDRYIIDDL